MKAVILAGGLGTRISEETAVRPKPMVEIGGMPILWHIMKSYSHYGVNDFIICCGYKGHMIKEFFSHYVLRSSDITFDLANNEMQVHDSAAEPWKVTLVDTGIDTLKGGRIKRAEQYLDDDINMLTYGDGVADVNIEELVSFHRSHGKTVTLTGVRPPSRFGELNIKDGQVLSFKEKPQVSSGMINGGFMVFNRNLQS